MRQSCSISNKNNSQQILYTCMCVCEKDTFAKEWNINETTTHLTLILPQWGGYRQAIIRRAH